MWRRENKLKLCLHLYAYLFLCLYCLYKQSDFYGDPDWGTFSVSISISQSGVRIFFAHIIVSEKQLKNGAQCWSPVVWTVCVLSVFVLFVIILNTGAAPVSGRIIQLSTCRLLLVVKVHLCSRAPYRLVLVALSWLPRSCYSGWFVDVSLNDVYWCNYYIQRRPMLSNRVCPVVGLSSMNPFPWHGRRRWWLGFGLFGGNSDSFEDYGSCPGFFTINLMFSVEDRILIKVLCWGKRKGMVLKNWLRNLPTSSGHCLDWTLNTLLRLHFLTWPTGLVRLCNC